MRSHRPGPLPIVLTAVALAAAGCGTLKHAPAPTGPTTNTTSTRTPAHPVAAVTSKHKTTPAKKKPAKAKTTSKTTPTTASTSTPAPNTSSSTPSTSTTTSTPAATPTGVTIDSHSGLLGTILVDAGGRTLYLFKKDTGGQSSCYASCATTWPPMTTSAAPVAGSGVNGSLLGTTTRSDGKLQVTYNGHPLYYFAGDSTDGATNGQGLKEFGAKWWVVSPAGHAVKRQ